MKGKYRIGKLCYKDEIELYCLPSGSLYMNIFHMKPHINEEIMRLGNIFVSQGRLR